MDVLDKFGIEEGFDQEQKSIYILAATYSLIEKKISDYLRPYNLSTSQFNALLLIKHMGKDKGISQVDVGERLIVTASNMTRLLDKLSNEGLIEKDSQEGDRRVKLVKITPKGSDLLDKAWLGYQETIKEIADKLKDDELINLSSLLSKWFESLS